MSQSSNNEAPGLHPLASIDRIIHSPARLMVMTYLYVVESADFVYLANLTGLTGGNLSSHLSKLSDSGYISIEKAFRANKPHTLMRLTDAGRQAFRSYKDGLQRVLGELD